MKQIICSLMALLAAVTCVACNGEIAVDDSQPGKGYIIDRGIVILSQKEDGTVIMEIGENTTLEMFSKKVTAEEGYRIVIADREGNEVTESSAVIIDGMTFHLYETNGTRPVQSMDFHIVDPQTIRKHYQNIAQ